MKQNDKSINDKKPSNDELYRARLARLGIGRPLARTPAELNQLLSAL